jgi:hypothetical protein
MAYKSLFMAAGIIHGVCNCRKKSVFGLTTAKKIHDDQKPAATPGSPCAICAKEG